MAAIIFVVTSVVVIKNTIYSGMLDQSKENLKKISFDGSQIFDKKLSKYADNFLNVIAFSSDDCFRNDYPFAYMKSYYNWPDELIGATYSPIYHANITLKTSSINVYNKTIYDLPYLDSTLQDTINRTVSLDKIFIPLYKYNNDFLAGYIATVQNFLRYYPGAFNNNKLYQYINYLPTTDYWFTSTLQRPLNNLTFGSPYFDPIAGQFMISITKKIYNGTKVIGAAGGDLILNTIQNEIKNVTYLQNGRAILFDTSEGLIIADSQYKYTNIKGYADVQNLPISDDLWSNLQTPNELFETDQYYLVSNFLPNTDNKYLLVSIASKQDIYGIFGTTIESIYTTLIIDIILICILAPVITLIVVFMVLCLTNNIVSPIQNLVKDADKMINNIGSNNITENLEMSNANSHIKETRELQENFKRLQDSLKQQKVQPAQDNINNEFYDKQKPWGQINVVINTDAMPSAPPMDNLVQNM